MSKLLTNQISNYNDNGPVEAKEGLNVATGKPLQVAGANGTSGDYLKSTGSSVEWTTFPTIPAAQVNVDWNATSGVTQILNKPSLATVATSGSYTDLTNKPTIPAAQLQSDWNQLNATQLDYIKNKPTIFSGVYSDLSGRPQIPAAITDLADVNLPIPTPDGTYLKWDGTQLRWIPGTGSAGLTEVREDGSPQLGGNLDLNGHDITGGITSTIEVSGSTNKIKFLYNALTDLPSASDWHGMFAHVHSEGAAYFAHGGQWVQLANNSDIPTDTNTTYSQDAVANASGVTLRLTDSTGNQDDIAITAGANITIDQIGSNGFRIISTASGGGGATVTTDDVAPNAPADGDLWWKSDEGRLKVYYNDQNSSQWVDASPPLANTVLTNGTNKIQVSTTASATQDAVELWGGNAKRWRMVQGGTLLPNADDAYDIGSSSYKVRDLYLGPTSLHIGTLDISESSGKLVLPAVEMTGHMIPDSNAAYDLGNAEYKIRHLFLSDNTLYHQGAFIKTAQHDAGGSAQTASYVITLAKLKQALNASSDFDQFKSAILAITDAT